jgi:hypothetical protein
MDAGEVEDDDGLERFLDALDFGTQLRVRVPDHGRHHFVVMKTTETGIHSGRSRYLVACTSCEKLLHEATTGVWANIDRHLRGRDYLRGRD